MERRQLGEGRRALLSCKRLSAVALALLVGAAAVAAPAQGAERITATFLAEYNAPAYTIDQGEIVSLTNQDRYLSHGVSSDRGDGALFSAPVIPRGSTRLVRGAPFLSTGTYPFHCPVHPGMTSVLNVTAAGAPLPADGTAPGARVAIRTSNPSRLAAKGLKLVVTPSEPVDAVIRAGAAGKAIGRIEHTFVSPGRRAFVLKLSRATAGAVRAAAARGSVRVSVRVALTDAAGNAANAGAGRTFARPRAKKPKP